MINALLLDKPGSQSGVYYFATSFIDQLQKSYPEVSILLSGNSSIVGNSIIRVKPFPMKLRFIIESYFRIKYRDKYWLNFDYFLPYSLGIKRLGDAVVIHDFLVYDKPESVSKLRKFWIKWQFRRTAKSAGKIFTVSEFSAQRFQKLFPKYYEKCQVIPVPLDLSRFKNFRTSSNNIFDRQPYFLTISSPWHHKNLKLLDDVMPEIYSKYGITLIKVGARQKLFDPKNFYFKDLAVQDLGFVTNSILSDLLKSAKAVLAPSTYEGFGMTVYEALALGIPVIASDLAAYPVSNGLVKVSNYLNISAWKMAITDFINDPEYKYLDVEFDVSPYSSESIVERYINAITSSVRGR
jgi:glycosyltransferase involved in cell wall biosynthesis